MIVATDAVMMKVTGISKYSLHIVDRSCRKFPNTSKRIEISFPFSIQFFN